MELNKKASLVEIAPLLAIGIPAIVISLILIDITTDKVVDRFESGEREEVYTFPSVYVNTFINLPIDEELKRKYEINDDKIKIVRDLIIKNDERSKQIIKELRANYIDNTDSQLFKDSSDTIHSLYSRHSRNFYPILNTLNIVHDLEFVDLDDKDEIIKSGNALVYIKTSNGRYTSVGFLPVGIYVEREV